jgi:hypothetical protein
MSKLFDKTISSLKEEGVVKTFVKAVRYPFGLMKRRKLSTSILALGNAEARFTEIYKKNYWGSAESISGMGSTIEHTINLRNELPELFKKFSIKTVFDAPCGDFNWMKHVLEGNNVNYIGGDIVAPLIADNNARYRSKNVTFIHIDLIKEKFPKADLMICRDCLFHLSFHDTRSVLQNFIDAEISYLLTTTHIHTERFRNKDIKTGDFRRIDLFSAPYYFPKDMLLRIEDWKAPDPEREMCLWTRNQIIQALATPAT